MSFIDSNQYIIAWSIYTLAGVGCCLVWWKWTSLVKHQGWRDLMRGLVVVLIFTPWYVGEAPELYAPAIVVFLMDLFLEEAKNDMKGGLALLFSAFFMLIVLTIIHVRRNRLHKI
jgi:hypothetical protein